MPSDRSIEPFASGFTSAATAPLAGARATTGALGGSPGETTAFAQVVNGILLPIVAWLGIRTILDVAGVL